MIPGRSVCCVAVLSVSQRRDPTTDEGFSKCRRSAGVILISEDKRGGLMTPDLFSGLNDQPTVEAFDEGVVVLRRHAVKHQQALMRDIDQVTRHAPFRHMKTPGGHQMSAAMTCCGPPLGGWVTDETGYRYQPPQDPLSGFGGRLYLIALSHWPASRPRKRDLPALTRMPA